MFSLGRNFLASLFSFIFLFSPLTQAYRQCVPNPDGEVGAETCYDAEVPVGNNPYDATVFNNLNNNSPKPAARVPATKPVARQQPTNIIPPIGNSNATDGVNTVQQPQYFDDQHESVQTIQGRENFDRVGGDDTTVPFDRVGGDDTTGILGSASTFDRVGGDDVTGILGSGSATAQSCLDKQKEAVKDCADITASERMKAAYMYMTAAAANQYAQANAKNSSLAGGITAAQSLSSAQKVQMVCGPAINECKSVCTSAEKAVNSKPDSTNKKTDMGIINKSLAYCRGQDDDMQLGMLGTALNALNSLANSFGARKPIENTPTAPTTPPFPTGWPLFS